MDSQDDDGMESFEINDSDLQFALNPGGHRGLSKNQHIYGIWADKEESGEDESYSGLGSQGNRKRVKNYSAPVYFVSGGVKHGDRIHGESTVDSDEPQPRLELRTERPRKMPGANVFAGMRSSATHSAVDPKMFADWTKHSKGSVILNMMKSMGYVPGRGLGVKKQGIVEPIQPVVRPGRAAVGAYGKETKGVKFDESSGLSENRHSLDDSMPFTTEKRGNWRKESSKKAPVVRYKTIDEVLAEESKVTKRKPDKIVSNVKVIDMTGKEQKVYSGYDAFAAKTRTVTNGLDEKLAFDVPELFCNVSLLQDLTEDEIRQTDRQLRFLEDQTTALENDRSQLVEMLTKEREELGRMKQLLALLQSFDSTESTLDGCRVLFEEMLTGYYDEFRLFGLEEIAITKVLPLIREYFSCWNPLDDDQTNYGFDLMLSWNKILQNEDIGVLSGIKNLENITSFERLLWDGWMPSIRKAVLRWNPRDNSFSMLKVIEKWLPLLPLWIRENLLEQIIIPRISSEVDSWNPLVDEVPIHSWLHPWLDVMGDRLQPVYAPIRQKLSKALLNWNPTDHSALCILKPWKGCFAFATMSAFLAQNITPKLERALQEMVYDPTKNQRYDEFYATVTWIELYGVESVATILVRSFFPKWLETLCEWLESPRVLLDQVSEWYSEWKARVPVELSSLPIVREQLMRALFMVNQAKQGLRIQCPRLPVHEPTYALNQSRSPVATSYLPSLSSVKGTFGSYKEVVEIRARETGITYVPQPKRFIDGKPVFWFGKISVYIDRNVIFGFNTETQQWAPIDLDHLMSIC